MRPLVVLVITQVILESVAILLFGQPLNVGSHVLGVRIGLSQEGGSLTRLIHSVVLLVLEHTGLHE